MKKINLIIPIILISLTVTIFSCKKDSGELQNDPPLISFITPDTTVAVGETITVKGEASSVSNEITTIKIFVNDELYETFNYTEGNTETDFNFQLKVDEEIMLQAEVVTTDDLSAKSEPITISVDPNKIADIDGNVYKTITIGTQVWMAENLKTTKYNDGTDIPLVTDNTEWGNLTTPAYSWYDNDEAANKNTYGALYNFFAVETSKNICPEGWHVPTDEEWKQLETELGMAQDQADLTQAWRGSNEGSKLAGTAELWTDGVLKSDSEFASSGFNALPAGERLTNGEFDDLGRYTYFWTSTSSYLRGLFNTQSSVYRVSYSSTEFGTSIRCIKD